LQAIIEGNPENFHYHKAFDCKQRDVFPPNCKEEPSVKLQADAEDAAEQPKPRKQDGGEEFKVLDEVGGDEEAQMACKIDNKLTNDGNESQDEDLSSIKLDSSAEMDPETKVLNGNGNSAVLADADDMWEQEFAVGANN
jgi:hypothetical protein